MLHYNTSYPLIKPCATKWRVPVARFYGGNVLEKSALCYMQVYRGRVSSRRLVCRAWLNTAYLSPGSCEFKTHELDKVFPDSGFLAKCPPYILIRISCYRDFEKGANFRRPLYWTSLLLQFQCDLVDKCSRTRFQGFFWYLSLFPGIWSSSRGSSFRPWFWASWKEATFLQPFFNSFRIGISANRKPSNRIQPTFSIRSVPFWEQVFGF